MTQDDVNSGRIGSDDPIASLESEHEELLWLCDELECIADDLPRNSAPARAYRLRNNLRILLRRHHAHTEWLLLPMLRPRALDDDKVEELAAGLRRDNRIDDGYALEVQELLDVLAAGDQPDNRESAGYLLRGFFEALRRHLRCEQALLFPLARKRLTHDDLKQLRQAMAGEGAGGNVEF